MKMSGIDDLLQQAAFVFKGTVKETHAASLKIVTPSENTIIVSVDQVMLAPESMSDQVGQQVTIRLLEPGSVKIGQEFVFFTNSWLYGETLAVNEVGKYKGDNADLLQQIGSAIRMQKEDKIRHRMEGAELVVLGTVMELKKTLDYQQTIISEHDPQWWVAVITIEKVLKGTHKGKTITVMFPSSDDVKWHQAPKFSPNQNGIWFLRRGETALITKSEYTTLDPLDFQTRDLLEPISAMLE